jgi:septal ring factor EnvC (AmiA/AmiB activator)
MEQSHDDAATRVALAALPPPELRPPRPGEAAPPLDGGSWRASDAPYLLPVGGVLVTGLGEVSDAGVRARGLTLAPAGEAEVVAPADGTIAYAKPFRDYGEIVIIDHGGGWTTLVTGLATLAVRRGEAVRQGDVIGRTGARDDGRESTVTVELRRKGRPMDMTALLGG